MTDSKDRKPTRRAGMRMLGVGGAWAALELGGSRQLTAAAKRKATTGSSEVAPLALEK